eukprot:3986606-Heterocapsa_arctica.AAC.1
MESESVLKRGDHTGKDRAHCFVPCNNAVPEKEFGQVRSSQMNEGGGKEYHPDEEEGHTFLRDCGSTEVR